MISAAAESAITIAKFRGCLIGGLLGDCFGAPFENDTNVSRFVLGKYFDTLEDPKFKAPIKNYTDDTAMTKSIAISLIRCGNFDEADLAKRFVHEFFDSPRRGYGEHVVEVFRQLRREKFKDVWAPAQRQFNGGGSYGNGGAMRVAPVALFAHSDYNKMIEIARKSTEITHTHRLGVNGALLQCAAVHMSLNCDSKEPINVKQFTCELKEKIVEIEKKDEVFGREEQFSYRKQVELIEKLLVEDPRELEETIATKLGNSVAALYSVPIAIYCFLRGQKPVEFIKTDNPFRRVLELSILMGGDTDTIACMAGAIAGAYYSIDGINVNLQNQCEGYKEITQIADSLYERCKSF